MEEIFSGTVKQNIVKDVDRVEEENSNVIPDEGFDGPLGQEGSNKTLKRLDRAWKAITLKEGGLLEKSKTDSLKEGMGMSIFRFLRPSKNNERHNASHNCEYYYSEKDSAPWTLMLNAYPRKEEFLEFYSKNVHNMYVVSVSVPEHEAGESTVQEIKIFNFLDDTEVDF